MAFSFLTQTPFFLSLSSTSRGFSHTPPRHTTTVTILPLHSPNPPSLTTALLSDLKSLLHLSSTALHSLNHRLLNCRRRFGQFVVKLNRAAILRSILRVRDCNLLHLYDWIMANSPRYGVVIDCAMRDLVAALVKFSLKVIVTEAVDLAGFMYGDGETKEMEKALPGLGNRRSECPVLVRVMVSVLYDEVSGKNFAIDLLKDLCIACWCKVLDQLMVARQSIECETIGNSVIFISQMVADQCNVEHAHVSKLARLFKAEA